MRVRQTFRAVAVVAFTCAVVDAQSDRIAAEIARLKVDAPKVLPDESKATILSRLDRATSALAGGETYLALYDLQPAFEAEAGYRLAVTEREYTTHDAFVRKWTGMGAPAEPPTAKAPVTFVEALAQSAEGRAPATYRASRPYAEDAGRMAGLYYLGESHAMVRFAAWCRALKLPAAPGPAVAIPSVEPALADYEKEVVKAYDEATAAVRPRFAPVSVAIKLARTLSEQGRREGALLQYLVSRYRFGMIRAGNEPARTVAELEARLNATAMPAGADHTIGEFFVQLAQMSLKGTEPAPQNAAVILDDILPAYFAVVMK
jgi:hypothetical protein